MREIKFRVFAHVDEVGMAMVYLDNLECDNGLWFSSKVHIDDYSERIMQYTGLKDKNGREIYEGDILLCHEYDSSDCGHRIVQTFKNAVVGFDHGSFYYYPKGNMRQPHQLLMYAYQPEVIGNIYENPELL